jgi:hypothetical protein
VKKATKATKSARSVAARVLGLLRVPPNGANPSALSGSGSVYLKIVVAVDVCRVNLRWLLATALACAVSSFLVVPTFRFLGATFVNNQIDVPLSTFHDLLRRRVQRETTQNTQGYQETAP